MTAEGTDIPKLPLIELADRHFGLTSAIAATYLEAAEVSLERHHQSPTTFEFIDDDRSTSIEVIWRSPSPQTRLAWANETDATEAGAYACAIAALELSRGLYAIQRAETLTGADYYIAPIGNTGEDLEHWYRLEISGTHLARIGVNSRLKTKIRQAQRGQSKLPAIAAVVGFKVALIVVQTVERSL